MELIECSLPIALIGLSYFLKLFLDRKPNLADTVITFIELPNNIILQGTVFVIAFTITPNNDMGGGMLLFIFYLFALTVIIVIGRRASDSFLKNKKLKTIALTSIELTFSVILLIYAIHILVGC